MSVAAGAFGPCGSLENLIAALGDSGRNCLTSAGNNAD
jgi:acyl CoA:acetate/3-ketoacid CoA transferase alpha subunit